MGLTMQSVTDFASFQARCPDEGFCQWLRQSSGSLWSAMIEHRFTRDIATDRLPPEVFVRYLRFEHAFVRRAVLIFAHALIVAPTVEDRAHIVAILNGLVSEQETFFQNHFRTIGVSPEILPVSELPDGALALSEGALAIAAHGSFEEILSAMLAAEWMYHHWCTAAHMARPQQSGPADWIALHVAPGFSDEVAWGKNRLDYLGPRLNPGRQERCAANFARMLRLEIAFHNAPYDSPGSSTTVG
jgi:thiaminase (transcriptional activator TenA)